MNTIVIKRGWEQIASNVPVAKPLAAVVIVSLLAFPATREIALASLADAYYQVSVFVAATLLGLLLFEKHRNTDFGKILRRWPRLQVPMAATFGALPGCGGAIVITSQYIRGAASFGSLLAVLTATMGDAAFLLLAKDPATALLVYAICWAAGIVTGFVVDRVHGADYLRPPQSNDMPEDEKVEENPLLSPFYYLWMWLFVPGAVVGVALAFQVDAAAAWEIGGVDWVTPFGVCASLLVLAMWALNHLTDFRLWIARDRTISRRIVDTTNFVSFWVVCGYLAYELFVAFSGVNLAALFSSWPAATVLAAILIGFIPGCGPQIMVTTLYINGVVPFSALIANAVANDGDALFPALAITPRAALIATLYSAVPAAFIGFGWLLLFEG